MLSRIGLPEVMLCAAFVYLVWTFVTRRRPRGPRGPAQGIPVGAAFERKRGVRQ